MTDGGANANPGGADVDLDAHQALTDALAEVAMTCIDEDARSLKRHEIVEVTAFDVTGAARCQAWTAAPAAPFQADLFNTTKTLALRGIPGLRRTGSALDAVSTVMREAQRSDDGAADDDWLRRFLKESPIDVRARVAARAAGWLTRTVEILGVTDLAETRSWRTSVTLRWDYPGRGLRLRAKVDLAVPDPARPGVLLPIMVAPSGRIGLDDELGFLHLLWKSSHRPVIDRGDTTQSRPAVRATGSRSTLSVDRAILVDHREANSEQRNLAPLAGDAVDAVVRAAQAVTERDRIAGLAAATTDQSETAEHSSTDEWPEPVIAACFPSQLDRQPSRFTCAQCRWNTVCDVAFGAATPSPSVSVPDTSPLPRSCQNDTSDSTATTEDSENVDHSGHDQQHRDAGSTMASKWVVIGGIRLSDSSSG